MIAVVVAVAATVTVYLVVDRVAGRLGRPPLATPVLWTSLLVLAGLALVDLDVADYVHDARPLRWALAPATVALGAPLAREVRRLAARRDGVRVLVAVLVGGAVASACGAGIAVAFDATDELVAVMAAKSVTTPIAVAIDFPLPVGDGLVAAAAVLAGVYGAVLLPWLARRLRLDAPREVGVGAGVVSHAVASAELARTMPTAAGWAVAGLAVNGVLTTLWLPPVLRLLL